MPHKFTTQKHGTKPKPKNNAGTRYITDPQSEISQLDLGTERYTYTHTQTHTHTHTHTKGERSHSKIQEQKDSHLPPIGLQKMVGGETVSAISTTTHKISDYSKILVPTVPARSKYGLGLRCRHG